MQGHVICLLYEHDRLILLASIYWHAHLGGRHPTCRLNWQLSAECASAFTFAHIHFTRPLKHQHVRWAPIRTLPSGSRASFESTSGNIPNPTLPNCQPKNHCQNNCVMQNSCKTPLKSPAKQEETHVRCYLSIPIPSPLHLCLSFSSVSFRTRGVLRFSLSCRLWSVRRIFPPKPGPGGRETPSQRCCMVRAIGDVGDRR